MLNATLGNGLAETRTYGPRTWLTSLTVGTAPAYLLTNLTYSGNGDVLSANDSANTNWTYTYDDFNRLKQATNTSSNPQQIYQYLYDRFGNRWQQNYTQGSGPNYGIQLTFNANNQINGISAVNGNPFQYDDAGNLMMDGHNCYSYDAENRLVSVVPETAYWSGVCGPTTAATARTYLYDPDGRRVAKFQNGSLSEQYYYDAGGHLVMDADGSGNTLRAEIYAGSRHLATWNPTGGGATYFNHSDWLGTERVRTKASDGSACETITSLPFGDGLNYTGPCSATEPSPNHFTGKERDSESGLDYFGARYNASSLGRFMTPDPGPYVWRDPQTLNRYAYTRNNPLRYVDPMGRYFVVAAEMQDLVKQYISAALRSPQGAAMMSAISANSKPNFFMQGQLSRSPVPGTNLIAVENGATKALPGNRPGALAGTQTTLDKNNILFSAQATASAEFYMGLKAFLHEGAHVVDMNGARALQQAVVAGAAGDAPSRPGAQDTTGGTAEARAVQIMGQLGEAGQNSQPDPQADAQANAIIQSGMQQYQQELQVQINQVVQHRGCTADSEGQHCD